MKLELANEKPRFLIMKTKCYWRWISRSAFNILMLSYIYLIKYIYCSIPITDTLKIENAVKIIQYHLYQHNYINSLLKLLALEKNARK